MKISIFGLGYVGAVSLACLGRDGHDVTGVDIDQNKLNLIAAGKSPIVETGILDLMRDVVASGRILVTDNAAAAIDDTDLSFICVGTPSRPNGSQSLEALKRLTEQIGTALKIKSRPHTLVIRSTVQPGTVEEVIIPMLEECSGKSAQKDFSVCFQPEFLREGSSVKDYDCPPMTVVGVADGRAARQLNEIFGHLPCKFIETDIRTAETLKYACNTFHALKISFANEIGRICQALGSDSNRVMELLCEDKQLNISEVYLRPGFAFGGSCLPKDLRALLYLAKSHDVEVPMLAALLPSNRLHVEHAAQMILERGERSVGIIGLSFKTGTDDLRESPLLQLAEFLVGKGIALKIYDPNVNLSRVMGANKAYVENSIPHIASLMVEDPKELFEGSSMLVVGTKNEECIREWQHQDTNRFHIIDLVGLGEFKVGAKSYTGICW